MTRLFLTMTDRLGIAVTATGPRAKATVQHVPLPAASIPFKAKFPHLLLRPVIGLLSCLVILSIGATVYGHLQATPNSSTRIGLDRCGIAFCFRGVMPGRTDWSRAQATLALMKNNQVFDHQMFVPIGSDGGAAVYPSADSLTVGLIWITFPSETPLTIGEIVDQYGPPCVLTLPLNRNDPTLILYYPFLTVFAWISQGRFTIDTPAKHIVLSAPTNFSQISEDPCREVALAYVLPPDITRPWRGFASVGNYLARN